MPIQISSAVGNARSAPPQGDDREPADPLPAIPAGWPAEIGEGCTRLDPAVVLQAKPRSFAMRVRGHSMIGAGIFDGDIVIGEFTPQASSGNIVVALIDGESTLKRLVVRNGKPQLISENPSCPSLTPRSELVIQGVLHTVVHRLI